MEFSFHVKTVGQLVVIDASQKKDGITTDCNAVMVPVSNGISVSALYSQIIWDGCCYSKYEWHNIFFYEMKMPNNQMELLGLLGM